MKLIKTKISSSKRKLRKTNWVLSDFESLNFEDSIKKRDFEDLCSAIEQIKATFNPSYIEKFWLKSAVGGLIYNSYYHKLKSMVPYVDKIRKSERRQQYFILGEYYLD